MHAYLHFIGDRYYNSMERFIEEGLRQGVQRAVPFSTLRGMKSGDVVYYAKYRDDVAIVFAYGRIRGISSTYPYQKWIDCVISDEVEVERRACGMSIIARVMAPMCTVEEVVKACVEHEDISVLNKHKWFILTDIDEYYTVISNTRQYNKKEKRYRYKPISFTRGYILLYGYEGGDPYLKAHKYRYILKYKEESAGYWHYRPQKNTIADTKLDAWVGGG